MLASSETVLIIDDDPLIRVCASRILEREGFAHESFATAEQFLQRRHMPELACVLLDVRMPGMSGLELQERLIREQRPMSIVFMTGYADLPLCVQAVRAGAIDFLLKPFHPEALIQSIRHAFTYVHQTAVQRRDMRDWQTRLATLTPREAEVLPFVATGCLNKQTAAELGTSEKTIKVHRARLMKKLGVQTVAELVTRLERQGASSHETSSLFTTS